jgi:PilZ domain-containing protein
MGKRRALGAVMLNGSMIPRTVRRMFDERSEPRQETVSQTAVLELRGRKHVVRLLNLSRSGAMISFQSMPNIGEAVAIHLSDRGRVCGNICWVRDGRIGVNFAAKVD